MRKIEQMRKRPDRQNVCVEKYDLLELGQTKNMQLCKDGGEVWSA